MLFSIFYVVRRQPYTLDPGKFVLAPKTWLFTVVKFRKGNVMEGDLSTAFAIDIIRNSSPLKKKWFHVKANYLRSNGPNDFSSTTIYEEEYSMQTDAYRLPLLVFTLFVFSFLGTPHSALRKNWPSDNCFLSTTSTYIVPLSLMGLATSLKMYVRGINIHYLLVKSKVGSIARRRGVRNYALRNEQGHPTSSFGKYLFGRRFEI